MEETSNDGSSSGLAFVDREFKGKIKYQARSQEEIAAALAVVEEGSNHGGSITGSDTALSPDGVISQTYGDCLHQMERRRMDQHRITFGRNRRKRLGTTSDQPVSTTRPETRCGSVSSVTMKEPGM